MEVVNAQGASMVPDRAMDLANKCSVRGEVCR